MSTVGSRRRGPIAPRVIAVLLVALSIFLFGLVEQPVVWPSTTGTDQPRHFYLAASILLALAFLIALLDLARAIRRRPVPAELGHDAVVTTGRRDRKRPPVLYGGLVFDRPGDNVRATAVVTISALFALGVWAAWDWHGQPVVAVLSCLVFAVVALGIFRLSQFTGGLTFSEERAHRLAPLVIEAFGRAGCPLPRVVVRQRGGSSAGVRSSRQATRLLLSAEVVDALDDRQLLATLAHEATHVVLGDLQRAKSLAFAFWVVIVAGFEATWLILGVSSFPAYMAAAIVAVVIARFPIGLVNRHLEIRADVEGARLIGDAPAMASALETVYRIDDARRAEIFGRQPWRVLLWPISWRPPSHPPVGRRVATLQALELGT